MHPVVSAVLIMAFSITIVSLVLDFGFPLIEEKKQELEFEHGKNLVSFFSISVSDLLDEPINCSKEQEIDFSNGLLEFSDNTISFSLYTHHYNKTFENVGFNKIEIPAGKTKIKLTKTSKNEIKVKILY